MDGSFSSWKEFWMKTKIIYRERLFFVELVWTFYNQLWPYFTFPIGCILCKWFLSRFSKRYNLSDSVTHKSPPLTLRHNHGRFSCPMGVRRIKAVMVSWSRDFTYHQGTAQKSVAGVVPPIRTYSDISCVTDYLINSNREAKGVIF